MKKIGPLLLILAILIAGCGATATRTSTRRNQAQPTIDVPTATPSLIPSTPTSTPRPVLPTETPIPAPTLKPTLETFPLVTFAQDTNCRKGPGKSYFAVLTYSKGQTTQANARNEDGSWISVKVPDKSDYCWVATSMLADFGNRNTLQVLEAQTLPKTPWEIGIVKKICGHPNIVLINWSQIQDATGYHVYRNGELVATNYALDNQFYDNPRVSQDYTYSIEAFNQFGVSNRLSITLNVCN